MFRLPKALPNREEGGAQPALLCVRAADVELFLKKGHCLAHSATAPSRKTQASAVAELARFFPEATAMRLPVQITRRNKSNAVEHKSAPAEERTVIEFGTTREVLFACSTPLEFADVLRLRNSDGSFDTEASVVAVQYHPGRTIVAARFVKPVPNWIVKS